jgi:hypothetical protein
MMGLVSAADSGKPADTGMRGRLRAFSPWIPRDFERCL